MQICRKTHCCLYGMHQKIKSKTRLISVCIFLKSHHSTLTDIPYNHSNIEKLTMFFGSDNFLTEEGKKGTVLNFDLEKN